MTTLEIENVINEVLKRLEFKTCAGRALLVIKENTAELEPYLKKAREEGYCVSQMLMKTQRPYEGFSFTTAFDYSQNTLSEDLSPYERLVVCGLSLQDLLRLGRLESDDETACVIFEALRSGKKVDVLSDAIDFSNAKIDFAEGILKILYKLESFGITFPARVEDPRSVIDKDVIDRQDLKRVCGSLIILRRKAFITESAMRLIEQRNIEIIRR